ncbi:Uncharacterised protein [Vibrio cholerae]|nr:Uncharacterised protein [Vibrio cholerae]CSB48089.1 Uncharacterised protein [Vibrio cholerae]CSD26185.1 Uncharacterised protein [Vibrio cholerae]
MSKHQHFHLLIQILQDVFIRRGDGFFWDPRHFGDHGFNFRHTDRFLTTACWHQTCPRTRFINHINRFIRQMTLINVFG